MENYRHALYRYSTGQGFNVNVDVPEEARDVASFKMEPLYTNHSGPEQKVDIKREADRVSMQMEAAVQQVKVLGYDSEAGKRLRVLKARVELVKHLMTNYPIRYVKRADLDRLYDFYTKNAPGMDKLINQLVNQNKGATGIDEFVGTAMRVRKGYPLYDKFGRRLTLEDKETFEKAEKTKELSGFGTFQGSTLAKVAVIGVVTVAVLKLLTNKLN